MTTSKSIRLNRELEEMAHKIAGQQADPRAWRDSIMYLVATLESHAHDRNGFESMLANLCEDIALRVEGGQW